MDHRTAWVLPNTVAWRLIVVGVVVGMPTVSACGSDVIVDDFRESAVVIRGRLVAEAPVDPGTQVNVSAIEPGFVDGVTVDVAPDGTFDARPSSFGAGSFDADLHFVAEGAVGGDPFVRETTLTNIRFREDRDGQEPDTVVLIWDVAAP